MKQKWSSKWSSSRQARKQRKYRYNTPLHVKRKFLSVNIAPQIRKQYGKRSVPVRKGDEVEVMRGGQKKLKGTVERVDLRKCKIYVEGINIKRADGSDALRVFDPSNLRITKLKLDDKMRQKAFNRAGRAKKSEPEKKKEPEKEKTKAKKEKPKSKAVSRASKKKPRKLKREKRRRQANSSISTTRFTCLVRQSW